MSKERTVYALANMADVNPDGPDSPGAMFLRRVESDVLESVAEHGVPNGQDEVTEDGCYWGDIVSETADGAVPIYTHSIWETFVDLAAYREDVSDYMDPRGEGNSLESLARVALYMVAERLAWAILAELAEDETAA